MIRVGSVVGTGQEESGSRDEAIQLPFLLSEACRLSRTPPRCERGSAAFEVTVDVL